MHIRVRNVNEAFRKLVGIFNETELGHNPPIRKSPSRVGDVLVIDEPVTVTLTQPRERVLFNRARDCNPFFHLFESLWMLAGRNDVAPLAYYSGKIGEVASDNGSTFNGAYGWRWRKAPGRPALMKEHNAIYTKAVDQLSLLIEHMTKQPTTRRAVLQMWTVKDDLLNIDVTKDVCCNTAAYFLIRPVGGRQYLDMTVTNRSNDLCWGMLGANVVHFSYLLEYMANCLGVEVGVYNQVSNNLHVYTANNGGFKPEVWLADETPDYYVSAPASEVNLNRHSLVQNREAFDREVNEFVELNYPQPRDEGDSTSGPNAVYNTHWSEPFLDKVAQPMMHAFHMGKARDYGAAFHWTSSIEDLGWRIAAQDWLAKRKANYDRKQAAKATPEASEGVSSD
jgi:thymidylate synthase